MTAILVPYCQGCDDWRLYGVQLLSKEMVTMRLFAGFCVALLTGAPLVPATGSYAQDKSKITVSPSEYKASIEGLVRDVACPMQNHRSTATSFNLDCAIACARSGSPLIILTKTGDIYFPTSDKMPDPSQREKMMPFVGKYVRVIGTVYRRNGTRTIVIKEITEMKGVTLNTTVGGD
jgi:hypothetical protein